MLKAPQHILVIRLSAMGDVAMTVPVLRALIKQHPDLRITFLTRAFFKPLFQDMPNVEVLEADVTGKHKGVLGLYKLSKEIKALNIDAVADLHNVLRSNILKVFLKGIPFAQINKGRSEKKALISGKIFQQLKTTHQSYADVFETLGRPVSLSNPSFPDKLKLSGNAKALLGNKDEKWIGMAPFAQYESKMYPLDLFEEVIEKLTTQYKVRVLLFGGGTIEKEQLDNIEAKHLKVVNLAGKMSLEEELGVISNLDLMLSMDSANGHLAAMFGVKVVGLWGVTHPYAGFYPFHQNENWALLADRQKYPKIPTSIYGNKYPANYKNAIESISPEAIVNKIKSML